MSISTNLTTIQQRIEQAAQRVGRTAAEITLVAVSKTQPFIALQAAYHAGQCAFGENRLEELQEKINLAAQDQAILDQESFANHLQWHMIGTIQSRKSKEMVQVWQQGQARGVPVVLIHSVDTFKLANRLSRDAKEAGCVLSILLEVNVSGEESKHGFRPDELRQSFAQLLALPNLRVDGLMNMAPLTEDHEVIRQSFRGLRQLQQELNATYPLANLHHLSMGMTNDFEIAIEEGATIVRIGSAIFAKNEGIVTN